MLRYKTKEKAIFMAVVFLLGIFALSATGFAQAAKQPKSLMYKLQDVDKIDQIQMPLDSLSIPMERAMKGVPKRVAVPMPLKIDIDNDGTREDLPDGGTLWRFRVDTETAHFMSYKFSQFRLPPGAELYFVSVYRDYQVGPFTHRHNQSTGRFGSPVIAGDASVIELYLPEGQCDVALTLESVSHGFRNALGMGRFPYRQTRAAKEKEQLQPLPLTLSPERTQAGPFACQRDINCPEGADYQDEKRAVSEGYDGTYICSGQLINNVRQDNRYLYITAAHCGWYEDPSTMSYYWNYENTGCGTGDYPAFTYSTGSTDLYHILSETRDIDLLELHGTDLEGTYNIYFMGWNRAETVPTSSAMISHPDDKPKQIVLRYTPIIDCAVGDCSGGWGDYFLRVDGWDVGVDEGGSSGGGLMDQDHLLVGTLTGGVGTNCKNFAWDEFAKISWEWAGLQPFLDPDNTGAMSVLGKDGLSGGQDPPGQASSPSPANGAVNIAVNAVLDWTAGSGTDTHRVYFGTNPSPGAGEFQGEQSNTGFNPGTLAYDTTYYWRIDEVNAYGTTTGDVWSFTTESTGGNDVVTILKAEWKSRRDELTVEATSSQQPNAVLTVVGFGTMTYTANKNKYTLKIRPVANPGTVTVTSSLGGSAAADVVIN